jgi:hypothetical protein
MNDLKIRELEPAELMEAAYLLSRGMRDNPNNLQAFGPDSEHRKRALARMFRPVLQGAHDKGSVLGAFREGALIGVYSVVPPRTVPA